MMNDHSARYRILNVSEMSGVAPATLRAWERRYGLPAPHRTDAAYRLYSRADVEMVKRMKALIDAGVAPNEAARQLQADVTTVAPPTVDADLFGTMVDRIFAAARAMDLDALERELQRALLVDSGIVAFDRVLRPALIRIGDAWHAGELSIAAEHLASRMIANTTQDLLRLTRVPEGARTVLLGCFADELHTLPLQGAALAFASLGVRPIVLGARTPPQGIARAIEAVTPDWVGLSATVVPQPPSHVRELVDGYADACGATPWFVGGGAAEALRAFVEPRGGLIAEGTLPGVQRTLEALRGQSKRAGARPDRAKAAPK